MDRFEELLDQFGRLINVVLRPDRNQACRLTFNKTLQVQLEYDIAKEKILIASLIAEIPPGKFRENILREALKANNLYPRTGTLGYSERHNKLALFDFLSVHGLTAEKLSAYLTPFVEKANFWRTSIESGIVPIFSQVAIKAGPSIFDIKR